MGLLVKLGDVLKGGINNVPGIGGISKSLFGKVGSRGIVGRIDGGGGRNGGGGLTAAASSAMPPGLPFELPDFFDKQSNGRMPVQQSNGVSGQISELLGSNQIIMEPELKTIHSAPPGWVIVTMPDGSKKAVLKDIAKCLGLWKARSKPPITAGQWKTLKKARSVEKKAKRIAEAANFKCTPKKTRR